MKKRTGFFFLLLAAIGVCAFLAALKVAHIDFPSLIPSPHEEKIDYSLDAPESDPAEDAFFENTAFIGHSLLEGLRGYSEIEGPDFYARTGFSVQQSLSYREFDLPNGGVGRLRDGLAQNSYEKVYLMFGINEISLGTETFLSHFETMVDLVREYQPDATIYILALTPTTQMQSENTAFNRKNIMEYNTALHTLCGERQCIFVNLFDCFADESGYLPRDKSSDGIHLMPKQYDVMLEYLKTHTTPATAS